MQYGAPLTSGVPPPGSLRPVQGLRERGTDKSQEGKGPGISRPRASPVPGIVGDNLSFYGPSDFGAQASL